MTSKNMLHQAVHGYARGHELLAASCRLDLVDADEMLRISDLSGSPVASSFAPYLTLYPLPSGTGYCIARTWLDPEAKRDGCVLTHTLIVPMDMWLAGVPATQLAQNIRFPERNRLGDYSHPAVLVTDPGEPALSGIRNPVNPEIEDFSARFFVLDRTPVVWPMSNGMEDSEQVTLRTADFLWPSARARFAACTYALQPRYLSDRPFELMFVPMGAMGRFSAIPEANIVSSAAADRKIADARQSAVATVVNQSLRGEQNIVSDMLRHFGKDLPPDRDALMRLVRIFELDRQAEQNPKAHLAALDLWMALAPSPEMAVKPKTDGFNKALSAADMLDGAAKVEYLSSLAQRLRRPSMHAARREIHKLGPEVVAAARRDPAAAVDLLSNLKSPPAILVSAASRALLDSAAPALLDYALKSVAPAIGKKLLTYSPALAEKAVTSVDDATVTPEALDKLNGWLAKLSPRVRRNLLRLLLDHPAILANDELAAATIEAATADDLEKVLSLPRSTHWPLGPEATRSIRLLAGADPARVAAYYVEQGIASASDVQLCADVVSDPAQLMSIVETGIASGSVELGGRLLAAALKGGVGMSLSTEQTLRAISILSRTDQWNDELLLPLVQRLSAEQALELPISGFAKAGAKRTAAAARLKAFEAAVSRHLAGRMPLDEFRGWIVERDRTQQLTRSEIGGLSKAIIAASAKRPAAATWQSLSGISSFLVRSDQQAIPGIIRDAFEKTRTKIDLASATSWVQLIAAIDTRSRQVRFETYVLSLRLASLEPRKPLGAIAVECFPLFYESVPAARQSFRLLDPFGLFDEPDRRKDARHELISHFLASDWDPADLALTARRAGIVGKTADRLLKTGQRSYLDRMINRLKARGQNDLARDLGNAAKTAKR